MSTGGVSGAAAASGALLIQMLKNSMQMQTEMAEKLIETQVQTTQQVQKMEIAGQIIDTYA